jgi:hypothetical protein
VDAHSAQPEDLAGLELRRLRDLDLDRPPAVGAPAHVASASGIVRRGEFAYVIGDDMLDLAVFELAGGDPGRLVPALSGAAPADPEERARHKPDLEALTALPPVESQPYGGLLGLGSGSKPDRDRGFFTPFGADGSLEGDARTIDLHPAYELLRSELGGINIEGAAVFEDSLWLFHRANRGDGANAVAEFTLADLSRTLGGDQVIDPEELRTVRRYDLGAIEDVPLCFSDATMLSDELVCFTASAERDDGAILGSVVGTIEAGGEVQRLRTIDRRWKVEGVDATVDTGMISFLFVCDQDDPDEPSPLLSATMPVEPRFEQRG